MMVMITGGGDSSNGDGNGDRCDSDGDAIPIKHQSKRIIVFYAKKEGWRRVHNKLLDVL